MSDNVSGTMNENQWYNERLRVTVSCATSDNEWQLITISGTTRDNE